MTGEEGLREQTRTAVDLLAEYHRSLAGTIIADEYISDLNPSRGAELCIAAEVLFSSAYIYQFLGDNDIADWVEQTAFNALPVSLTPDWWSHQYVQQENQVRVAKYVLPYLTVSLAMVAKSEFRRFVVGCEFLRECFRSRT